MPDDHNGGRSASTPFIYVNSDEKVLRRLSRSRAKSLVLVGGGGNIDCAYAAAVMIASRGMHVSVMTAQSAGVMIAMLRGADLTNALEISLHGVGPDTVSAYDSARKLNELVLPMYVKLRDSGHADPVISAVCIDALREYFPVAWPHKRHPLNYWVNVLPIIQFGAPPEVLDF